MTASEPASRAQARNMLGVLTDVGLHQTHVGATYCDSVLKGRYLKAWGKVRNANETPGYLPDPFQALKERYSRYVIRSPNVIYLVPNARVASLRDSGHILHH